VRRRRAGRLHLNAEINVVSLIDVMMLLLVIFMITAPLMQGGVDVKLPVASARPLDDKSSLVITIDRNGRIFLDRDRMTYGEFSAAAKTLLQKAKQQGVTVRADARANVEMLLRVVAVIRNAGVTSVGLVTDQEPPR
jgi:biopolymer transport protein ExbD/biopolymer transport protein TolR